MKRRGRARPARSEFVLDLPASDPFFDIMKPLLSEIQPGDLPVNPDDQVIYYSSISRSFRIPAMPLTKTHFTHLFGNSQNKPSQVKLAIEKDAHCQVKGDFRVRTIELLAKTKEDAVTGWTRVLDECCRMPSLRPKNYIVVDAKTHKVVDQQANAPVKEEKKASQWGHFISDLPDIVIDFLVKSRTIVRLQESLSSVAEVELDSKKQQIRLIAGSPEKLAVAKQKCQEAIQTAQNSVQELFLAVSMPSDFLEILRTIFLFEDSDIADEDIFAYLPLGEVVCTKELPAKLLRMIPNIHKITSGAPICFNFKPYCFKGKPKKVDFLRLNLATDENWSQIIQLQKSVFEGLERVQECGRISKKKMSVSVCLRTKGRLTLAEGDFVLPDGFESQSLCVGKPNEVPVIDLALT